MRYSRLLIPTVKEVPAEAEIPSHRLMIRAGFIRKLASGTYTYLPLGWRSLLKIIAIVREEMNAAGAQEILMPVVQPIELWQKTGRDVVFQDILGRFTDRHGRENVLAPTAEEVVTALAGAEISSYKQLPVNLYQINTKFRDEFRPQYGVLRSREFIMKDAYSFDADAEGLNESYSRMRRAYCRIFDRCGLKCVIVQAESGGMGGTDTEEFMVPMGVGDVLVTTEDGSYAASLEKAEVDPPAPAPDLAERRASAPAMEKVHTPGVGTIEAVCRFLGTSPQEMIKTLVYRWRYKSRPHLGDIEESELLASGEWRTNPGRRGGVMAVLVRGDHDVNEAKLRKALQAPALFSPYIYTGIGVSRTPKSGEEIPGDVVMCTPHEVAGVTGAAVGFAGPVGAWTHKAYLVIDHAVAAMGVGVSGASETDYHVRSVVPGRDFPLKGRKHVLVADIRNAVEGDTHAGKPLAFARGIEIGHVFKLGTKYSEQLGCTFLDESGAERPCIMGCYGIGINRILASAIEIGSDEDGCILPVSIAPFEVEVLSLNNDKPAVVAEAQRIYDELLAAGADVLVDDRDARPGVKFKDADLIGIPLRVVVGERGLKDGKVEVRRRADAKPALVPAGEAVAKALRILEDMRGALQGTS